MPAYLGADDGRVLTTDDGRSLLIDSSEYTGAWDPTGLPTGDYDITITVTDSGGLSDTVTVTVHWDAPATTPRVGYKVEIAPGAGVWQHPAEVPGGTVSPFVDVTDSFEDGFGYQRGRTLELDAIQPGRFSGTIIDRDRTFDPFNGLGQFYGQLTPRVPLRVTYYDPDFVDAILDEDGTPILDEDGSPILDEQSTGDGEFSCFYGYIETWPQRSEVPSKVTPIAVVALDAFALLAKTGFTPVNAFILDDEENGILDGPNVLIDLAFPAEPSGERIRRVLRNAGVPDDFMAIDSGLTIVKAETAAGPSDANVLAYCQRIAKTELARFYIDGAGIVHYEQRHHDLPHQAAVQATFTDQAGADYRYTASSVDPSDTRLLRNDVERGAEGIPSATVVDATSRDENGHARDSDTSLMFAHAADALGQAQYLVARFKDPQPRVTALTFEPFTTAQRAAAVGFELFTRIDYRRTPGGIGAPFTQTCCIENISVSVAALRTTCTWQLSQPDLTPLFTLDESFLDGDDLLGVW